MYHLGEFYKNYKCSRNGRGIKSACQRVEAESMENGRYLERETSSDRDCVQMRILLSSKEEDAPSMTSEECRNWSSKL